MQPYQQTYIENVREIAALSNLYGVPTDNYEAWYARQRRQRDRAAQLRRSNMTLLEQHLFPALDTLPTATAEDVADLEAFGEQLLDWRTNLDCGVYILIHDSLLSLYRIRRDLDGIIKELYKLGMGLYYQLRMVQGIDCSQSRALYFQNEMVFTEAGSYLKFFPGIENEATKGFIIRSLANVAICSSDLKRRVETTSRILRIVRDDYYRSMAPGLPWDVFLRRTNQQMSANRHVFSLGNLSSEETAAVLEACHEVFEPEAGVENPNVRWLWPYYEMEYNCGFVDLATTLGRMERLIEQASYDQHDISGLYANVQLAIYYGQLMNRNPSLQNKARHVHFLNEAYRKMLRTMLTYPTGQIEDYFLYDIVLVFTDYLEIPGVPTYREITTRLMQRLSGSLYISSRRVGDLLRLICGAILDEEPAFFDDIDFLRAITDPAEKRKAVLEYAERCGLYHDFGLIKMHLEQVRRNRDLFESEDRIMQLHTISGHNDLRARPSTEMFADVAFGHHRWYNGAGGYPEEYVRNRSPYRQMTDVVAVAAFLCEEYNGDADAVMDAAIRQERTRFSPLVTAYLSDEALRSGIREILSGDDERYYRDFYRQITTDET